MATARMPIRMEIGNHGPIEVGEVEFPARRGELGFVLDHPSVAAALRAAADRLAPPAPPVELTEAQRLAEGIICELVSEAEFGDIGDRLEDHAEGLAAIEFDQLHRNVADLISKATVTVTWPQDAEQAGGDA